jgi:hypothetical protein
MGNEEPRGQMVMGDGVLTDARISHVNLLRVTFVGVKDW